MRGGLATAVVLALLAGCAARGTAPVAPAAEAPAQADDTVSPPVTLEAFRAAFPVGTRIRLVVETAAQPPVEQRWVWTAADAEGCEIASAMYSPSGELVKDEGAERSTWAELMGHARFPADKTERADATITVPAGTFDTWLFTVRDAAEDGSPMVTRYHFAKTMPGPPVLLTMERGGVEVLRMTMLERTP